MENIGKIVLTEEGKPVIVSNELPLGVGSVVMYGGEVTFIKERYDNGIDGDFWLGSSLTGCTAYADQIEPVLLNTNQIEEKYISKIESGKWFDGQEMIVSQNNNKVLISCYTPCSICGANKVEACGKHKNKEDK